MFDLVLYQPEIPPNTGNIIRLCANTGARLHLVKPLGFELTHPRLQRAGLDYHEYAQLHVHIDWRACAQHLAGRRMFALTSKAVVQHSSVAFAAGDVFVFGPETRGLPAEVLSAIDPARRLRLAMLPASRSLNLSNAAAVVLYEAWRQLGFCGGV